MTGSSDAAVSDPPGGSRSRAGNAMGRTRVALLAAAASCVEKFGPRRTTMLDIAAAAGVAKGTVYNHFRTRSEIYRALADSELAALLDGLRSTARTAGPAPALAEAARAVAAHPVLAALRRDEPSALAALLCPGPASESGWAAAEAALASVVGPDRATLAVRWLASFAWQPAGDPAAAAGLLAAPAAGLLTAPALVAPVAPTAREADAAGPAPVG